MVGDPSYIPVGAHYQLKLHSIAPVILPPRCARARDPRGTHASTRAEAGAPPLQGDAQPRHVDRNQRNRSDSLLVSNAAIFSSPIKRAGQTGSIHVRRPHKRAPENGHLTRKTKRLGTAEPIAFDPFSESPYCSWLSRDPGSSAIAQHFRRDADNIRGFREWMTSKFPKVVAAFKALDILLDRPPPPSTVATPTEASATATTRESGAQQLEASDSEDEFDDVPESKRDTPLNDRGRLLLQQRAAQQQAWGVLLESARLLSIPPGDTFATQDVTPARDVFFVLSGQCQLLFQPKFLDLVMQTRNELKSNHASPKEGSPKHSKRAQAHQGSTERAERDPADLQSSLDALLAMRRLSLSTLTQAEASEAMAHAVYPLRVLSCGDHFGLEACAFRFPHHSVSAVSQGALHRNTIGVATQACLYVLVVPFRALETMRNVIRATRTLSSAAVTRAARSPAPEEESLFAPRRRAHVKRSIQEARPSPTNHIADALPGCAFRDEDVEFLRHTFLLQSIQLKRLQFLATQVRLIQVPKREYLFTTGQEVLVYLVKSGQLRVFSPEQVRIHTGDEDDDRALRDAVGGASAGGGGATTVETRHVELEILQTHDTIGLMEASLLQPTFSNYCLATSADVWVYAIPPVALFTVLAHEPTASHQVVENLLCHHSWYKARKFTALNHHNKQTEFRLSLGAQHKSPIPCSRCGWSGHSSTSSLCVRAASPKSAFIEHLMGKGEHESRAPIAHNLSLRTRMERASQLRLAQAHRSGSVVVGPAPADGDPDPACTGMPCTGPPTGSMVGGRGGGAIPTSGSMLPGLADLAMLLKGSQPELEHDADTAPAPKSEAAKALGRLDAALEAGELMPPLTSSSRSPWPASQQMQRRRPGESNEGQRGSVYNLRDEALRVVARIGTAATVAPGGARALTRRKAIDDR